MLKRAFRVRGLQLPAEHGIHLLFTCEHASQFIPVRYREVAERAGTALATHRGYDPGALGLAEELARHFRAPLLAGRYSRLLIELNRSPHHPGLWSEFSRPLSAPAKARLLEEYYHPYRETAREQINRLIQSGGTVIHISVHSFTPVLKGETRRADVGLLYDPRRAVEKDFCAQWKQALEAAQPGLCVRRNYPYLGVADGLVTHLRKQFAGRCYAGIELEVNQRHPLGDRAGWRHLCQRIAHSLEIVLDQT